MSEISIGNVFEVSVSAPGVSAGVMNTSNVAIFTRDPYAPSFGTDGYKLYVDPTEVGKDFGTASISAKMANAVFAQRPNIRAGGGYLALIPMLSQIQEITFDKVPTGGSLVLNIGGQPTAAILFSATQEQIQAAIRAVDPILYKDVVVTGTMATKIDIDFKGLATAVAVTTGTNTLTNSGAVVVTVTETVALETPVQALARGAALVHFFGLMFAFELAQAPLLAVAAALSPLRKIGFFLGSQSVDNDTGGKLDLLRQNGYVNSRGLLRIDNVENGLVYQAAYVGRALSVDFSGTNTVLTMHLKDLASVIGDKNITQAILEKAKVSGADVYVNFDRNVAKTFTSGGNDFFDNVYNILSFIDAIQIAGFNVFGQTPTKIPQTEGGMDILKGASRKVCEQYVRNGFIAPGEWNSPVTFGPQEDFLDNIRQRGYYIYSAPISQQPVVDREARKAPLQQLAIKYAGAFHSGSIIITINE